MATCVCRDMVTGKTVTVKANGKKYAVAKVAVQLGILDDGRIVIVSRTGKFRSGRPGWLARRPKTDLPWGG
jgi:hypothetical protein